MRRKVYDYLVDFAAALRKQLVEDDKRWGDTWLKRTREGQEVRTFLNLDKYYDRYITLGEPIPWLKVAGEAMICWIREQHPEIWPE